MNARLLLLLLSFLITLVGCRTVRPDRQPIAGITKEGFMTCFAPETSLNSQPVWCEASAVLFDGKRLLLANDKDMPANLSPVFIKTPETLTDAVSIPVFVVQPAYAVARKYEDFTQTPDHKFILLATAFDRVKPNSHDWDGYNTILYWKTGDEQHPSVLAPDDSSLSSISFHRSIARLLATDAYPGEIPYFKVEGLAATDTKLLFGIREAGQSYERFDYQAKVVSVSYRVVQTNGTERIRLGDDWTIENDFDVAKAAPDLPKPLGLSSLEYDPYQKCFWMLTSLEQGGKFDSYLWRISPDDLFANKPFTLVHDAQGNPLHLAGHKAEDVTPLDKHRLLLICDDDRVRTTIGKQTRQPNQAAYVIVTTK